MYHPSAAMIFNTLESGLEAAVACGHVYRREHAPTGLVQYTYTVGCVYERAWNDFTRLARGIVLDPALQRIAARPFPKFFNPGEMGETIPDLPFEAYEKLDGSLIILFNYNGVWITTTKGSFWSDQAVWALNMLNRMDLSVLDKDTTYLLEAVYPENRIVVAYEPALVMLGGYEGDGKELEWEEYSAVGERLGIRSSQRFSFANFTELVAHAEALPASQEGFVVRFSNGLRLKIKGEEYRRIHSLISRCTPLALWEMIVSGDSIEANRKIIPEEYWSDFDAIHGLLEKQYTTLVSRVHAEAEKAQHLSDKELGLNRELIAPSFKGLVFSLRKSGGTITGQMRDNLYKMVRPDGNKLDGYKPSSALHNAQVESG